MKLATALVLVALAGCMEPPIPDPLPAATVSTGCGFCSGQIGVPEYTLYALHGVAQRIDYSLGNVSDGKRIYEFSSDFEGDEFAAVAMFSIHGAAYGEHPEHNVRIHRHEFAPAGFDQAKAWRLMQAVEPPEPRDCQTLDAANFHISVGDASDQVIIRCDDHAPEYRALARFIIEVAP